MGLIKYLFVLTFYTMLISFYIQIKKVTIYSPNFHVYINFSAISLPFISYRHIFFILYYLIYLLRFQNIDISIFIIYQKIDK